MKSNNNNLKNKEYYIGLDIGTNSVGFATTDENYELKKHSGKAMWGVRLFDEGETAESRRLNRTNRRRLSRRNQRLELLEMLFDEEITAVDSGFFMRMKESFLCLDDKTKGTKYSLFADKEFTDKDYMKKYPTIYHLRNELVNSKEEVDIRLVYLAIRHIIKNRGHFLFDVDSENNQDFNVLFDSFAGVLYDVKEISLDVKAKDIYPILTKKAGKLDKIKEIINLIQPSKDDKKTIEKLFGLMIGGTAKISDILETDFAGSLSFDMGDEKLLEAADEIGNDFDLIYSAKAIYDCLILEKIMKGYKTLSEYKIAEYEQHKNDIKSLKDYIKCQLKNEKLYKEIFKAKKEKLNNYSAYSGYKKSDKECHCTQEEFCKYLKSVLPKSLETSKKYSNMYQRILEGVFAPKLRKTENGVIPNSLHRSELVAILENASASHEFFNKVDETGISVKEKIISIFDYRIPYYIGPLKNGWAVRKEEGKIYPWNFNKKINLESSAENFITRMTSQCTYTGEYVLPKESLLYSEFEVLNEINNIKVNGKPITVECKKLIFDELFVKSNKKVTKKRIETLLISNGLFLEGDLLSGVDDNIKSQLNSYHKLKNIISKTSYETAEDIIRRVVLFGDDKKLLKKYLETEIKLSDDDVKYVLNLKFKDWGRLSKKLLTGIESVNPQTGEVVTIMDMLRDTNLNLMKLLSNDYSFKSQADEYKSQKLGVKGTPREMVDNLYVSPKIKRSIWQTLRILDEIVDIEKGAPKKIFIEVARDRNSDNEKKRTDSRKNQLLELYKNCTEDAKHLFNSLNDEKEENLRRDKLFLYYQQFGKCMYSGEPIEIEDLEKDGYYDIDHIYPRSKIKDDSINNRVLVKAELNREKTNIYPISNKIRNDMHGFWHMLLNKHAITPEKYERLIRHNPLTADELASFINRQIVETRQSTKAVAELLKTIYPNTKIVYSKAGNISDFRKKYDFVKCREINDHHHAKDAYLNVVVGNYFDTRFTEGFIKNILSENYSLNVDALYDRSVKNAWIAGENGTIATVNKTMNKNNILFTVMPKEEKGQLFDVTLMKKGNGQVPIKNEMDISKYGGYNKASGAYFAVVEHTENDKKIRSIEPVLKHQKDAYEKDPQSFAKKYWYNDSSVIIEKMLFSTCLELDGLRCHIRGRTGDQIVYTHAHQFVIYDTDVVKYLKNVCKYVEKCKEAKQEILPSKANNLSKEENVSVYDMFMERIGKFIYAKFLNNMALDMKENREKFKSMSLYEQCLIIKEVLKAFKCDASNPSFKELCGKGTVGRISKSKKVSNESTAYIVHQSVTGIFETKINLLK